MTINKLLLSLSLSLIVPAAMHGTNGLEIIKKAKWMRRVYLAHPAVRSAVISNREEIKELLDKDSELLYPRYEDLLDAVSLDNHTIKGGHGRDLFYRSLGPVRKDFYAFVQELRDHFDPKEIHENVLD